jgi:hypothetical protein
MGGSGIWAKRLSVRCVSSIDKRRSAEPTDCLIRPRGARFDIVLVMDVGDTVEAPPYGGGMGDKYVRVTITHQLRGRRERDFSDGSTQVHPQVRVRYANGRTWDWDEVLLRKLT